MNKETEVIKDEINTITDKVVEMLCKANHEKLELQKQINILSYFIDKTMDSMDSIVNYYYIKCSYYYKQYIKTNDSKYIYSIIDIVDSNKLSYHSNLQEIIDYALRKVSMK